VDATAEAYTSGRHEDHQTLIMSKLTLETRKIYVNAAENGASVQDL